MRWRDYTADLHRNADAVFFFYIAKGPGDIPGSGFEEAPWKLN